MAVTSVARLATGRTAAPARSILREDRAAKGKARWEPSQGAVHTAASREGLPRDEAIA
jgi:hypothetical protein